MAVDMVGIQSADHLNRIFQLTNHEFAVSSFNPSVSISGTRTGHARFRRGPIDPQATTSTSYSSPPPPPVAKTPDSFSKSVSISLTTSSSLASSNLAGEASVSNGNLLSSSGLVAPVPAFSAKKPPLPTSHRKRTASSLSLQGSAGDRCLSRDCHCCKIRKLGVRRQVKRIPILDSKVTSIPADDYSWKKYGEKTADGSRYPRVYYKCNSVRGCPARKRVELALDDTKTLIVTYDREHRHSHAHAPSPVPVPASFAVVTV